ncbi:hypothetical protein UCRPC4_g02357 [Phaeomoniella chlamydospora]|uniref:Ribosomal protein s17 n=1 Tax=Phaeomoniella chlamydospora TaxID=158046 RepID=A0A0G2ER25_PHACM|nr:hypothetical protein UCRPC4_g02357 [Phaeomoniella chlamydospora]
MAPSRALSVMPMSKIFEEAASAACRKTNQPSAVTRRFFCSAYSLRPTQTNWPNVSKFPPKHVARISTATEAVSKHENAALPDPMGALKDHSTTPDSTNGSTTRTSPNAKPDSQYPLIVGRVTKAGLNRHVVQVTRNIQKYDSFLKKHYKFDDRYLVLDPHDSLIEGDVIDFHKFDDEEYRARIEAGKGKQVKHVVNSIISPFGKPIDERPAIVNNANERMKTYWSKKVQEKRERDKVTDVTDRMVKMGKNKTEKVIIDKLEAAEEIQGILNERGVSEKEVERRVKQANI